MMDKDREKGQVNNKGVGGRVGGVHEMGTVGQSFQFARVTSQTLRE